MSTDCVLVTAVAPTLDDLHVGGMQAVSIGRLDAYELDGRWGDDPVVGFAGYLDRLPGTAPLIMQVGRPRHVRAAQAGEVSTDLFVSAPIDDDGCVWLTDLTMVNPGDAPTAERQFLALMAVAAPIASARRGYLVLTSGETAVVPLDGVAQPEPLSLEDLPERATPVPPAQVFAGAFLAGAGSGTSGWRGAVHAVRTLSERMPATVPDHVLTDEEWQPLDLDGDPPSWWPMQQSLYAAAAQFSWLVDGSEGTPDHPLVSVLAQGLAPDQASPALGQGLVALAGEPLDYAYAHAWHPDEPWTGPVGPRMSGNGPYFMLAAHDLDRGLPNLYWMQVLGPRWVERIGRERLASTPAHRVAEVSGEHWLIQLAPSLAAVADDYPAFVAAREAAIDHLGREHFPFVD